MRMEDNTIGLLHEKRNVAVMYVLRKNVIICYIVVYSQLLGLVNGVHKYTKETQHY